MRNSALVYRLSAINLSTQSKLINKHGMNLLQRFNMTDCNPANTPAESGQILQLNNGPKTSASMSTTQLIGGLVYLTVSRKSVDLTIDENTQLHLNYVSLQNQNNSIKKERIFQTKFFQNKLLKH